MGKNKTELLSNEVRHIDIKKFDFAPLIDQRQDTACQARNLAHAAQMYDHMLTDKNCSVFLCLAGSLISAGLKKVILDLIKNNMVDAIVSSYAYSKGNWRTRKARAYNNFFNQAQAKLA